MAHNERVPGVLAYGVRFPDKSSLNESYSVEFPLLAMENAWRCVADTYQVLTLHRLPVARMNWVYERSLLTCVRRNDGLILGLFLTARERSRDTNSLERLVAEFQALEKSPGLATPDGDSTASQ
jgi:hypothetical protein